MLKEFSLEGKTALITGGGRGLGKAMALVFAEAGCDVALVARTRSQVEEAAQEIRDMGRQAVALVGDVTEHQQVDDFVAKATEALGKIDILVNNAGVGLGGAAVAPMPGPIDSTLGLNTQRILTPEIWDNLLKTNLTSAFYCCRAVGRQMMERRYGKVINILSSNAVLAYPLTGPYNASKAGLRMFTKVLALEWAPYNVNVNAIGPGAIRTEMTKHRHDDPVIREKLLDIIPLRKFTTPRHVGLLALYLASPASDWMTGQMLYLDGGESALHN